MPSLDFHFITALLYASAAALAWWPRAENAGSAENGGKVQSRSAGTSVRTAYVLGLVAHGLALGQALFGGDGLNMGFSHAISLIAWLVMGAYFLIGFDNQLSRLAALYLAPLALLAALLPWVLPGQRILHYPGAAFQLHFVVAILAYALFTVATLHALLMLFLEQRLHQGALTSAMPSAFQGMPPLMRVEKLLFQLLGTAFLLLTLTLVSGAVFSEELFGKAFQVSYKTVFGLFSWVIFGGLLLGHWKFGWRGTVAVRWTLIGFGLLLLSYVGSKFVSEIILHRV